MSGISGEWDGFDGQVRLQKAIEARPREQADSRDPCEGAVERLAHIIQRQLDEDEGYPYDGIPSKLASDIAAEFVEAEVRPLVDALEKAREHVKFHIAHEYEKYGDEFGYMTKWQAELDAIDALLARYRAPDTSTEPDTSLER